MTGRLFVFPYRLLALLALVSLSLFPPAYSSAQERPADELPGAFPAPSRGSLNQLGDFGLGARAATPDIMIFAAFTEAANDQAARLFVTAEMAPEWHVYSITQPPKSVLPTIIKLDASTEFELLGKFQPDRKPEVRETDLFPVPLEEHYNSVTFSAPIRLAAGIDPAQLRIGGEVDGMVCHDERGCRPLALVDTTFEARLATGTQAASLLAKVPPAEPDMPAVGSEPPPAEAAGAVPVAVASEYRAPSTHVSLSGLLQPQTVPADTSATLVVTATPDLNWHIYAFGERSVPDDISNPTRLVLQQPAGWILSPLTTSAVPIEHETKGYPVARWHEQPVTWNAEIRVPPNTPPGDYEVIGLLAYQSCSSVCDRPVAATFSATLRVGPQTVPGQVPLRFAAADEGYKQVARLADAAAPPVETPDTAMAAIPPNDSAGTPPGPSGTAETSETAETAAGAFSLDKTAQNTARKLDDFTAFKFWAVVIPSALLGGLILNIMPCVLPVIGLKIMGFVSQAGESRGRIFALNVWYAVGLLSVFLILATPMAMLNASDSAATSTAGADEGWGWGQQFNNDVFNIAIIAIVFVMALAFVGVWEIPIPGFAAGSTATDLAEKEGPAGAFAKGVVTTILATPCTGPGIAFAMTWCRAMSVTQVYLFFGAIALGMASPYLVIGAFPRLIKFLPKPGAWMETVKQGMGFVLLATVVWLFSNIQWANMVPTLALMFGLWAACWWIGRIPFSAGRAVKVRAWVGAVAFATFIGLFAFFQGGTVGGFPIPGLAGMMQHKFQASVESEIAELQQGLLEQSQEAGAGTGSAEGSSDSGTSPADGTDPSQPATLTAMTDANDKSNDSENEFELPWQRFSIAKLEQLTAQNKTVMVDFTADWCLTCKTLEQFVLNTQAVREAVDRNGVVPLIGNWSNNQDVGTMLNALNSKQVPVLAIFPAGRPNDPIVISGPYSKTTLIGKLEEAGPSANDPDEPRPAMRVP